LNNLKKYALWIHVAVVMTVYYIETYARPQNFEYVIYTLTAAYALAAVFSLKLYFKTEENAKASQSWFFLMAALLIGVVGY
jgi:hypothetical protein